MDIQPLLEHSSRDHSHLCPRQILGVRIGLAGMKALGFNQPSAKKQLLVISETDGCFVDGVIAATGCTVGHRTLRVEDYGKVAATFVDTVTGQAVRVAPVLDVREKACTYVPDEPRHYFAQMQAYQVMPDDEMLTTQNVVLNSPIEQTVSRPGVRVNCDGCGEEIMNEREVYQNGIVLCQACAHGGYYQPKQDLRLTAALAVETPIESFPTI
jgi:formylmethanofuran dehydrogenase subunit E